MSSSNKTEYLKLNAWLGTDRPQRIDFVDDNTIIDNAFRDHIGNTTMHCSGEEKTKINNPFIIKSFAGTGESSYNVAFDFYPKFAIAFMRDALPVIAGSDGTATVNFGIAVKSVGTSGGVTISDKNVNVKYNSTPVNGIKYNLNAHNGQYVVIAFK